MWLYAFGAFILYSHVTCLHFTERLFRRCEPKFWPQVIFSCERENINLQQSVKSNTFFPLLSHNRQCRHTQTVWAAPDKQNVGSEETFQFLQGILDRWFVITARKDTTGNHYIFDALLENMMFSSICRISQNITIKKNHFCRHANAICSIRFWKDEKVVKYSCQSINEKILDFNWRIFLKLFS